MVANSTELFLNTSSPANNWYILGSGAVGCLWAAKLAEAGAQATLIVRDTSSYPGWITLTEDGMATKHLCPAVEPGKAPPAIERLIIATKAHQTEAALVPLLDKLAQNATVLVIQNGMGVCEHIQALGGELNIFGVVSTDGVYRTAPFEIIRAGIGENLVGRFPADNDNKDETAIRESLHNLSLNWKYDNQIRNAQWTKLAASCVINPLTAIYEINNGELPRDPETSKLLKPLCDEVATIASACGNELSSSQLQDNVIAICEKTADNISSMLQDLRAGRPSEIEFITGYLVDQAKARQIPCELNQQLLNTIQEKQLAN